MELKKILDKSDLPLSLAVSSCLLGENCNYEGTNNLSVLVKKLQSRPDKIKIFPFCPEDSVLGTPREPMNIHDGDGFKVLLGEAKVLSHTGDDVTESMLDGAKNLLKLVKENHIAIAILKEGSPSCGSTRIYRGEAWPKKEIVEGPGVTAALLMKSGVYVLSASHEKELQLLIDLLNDQQKGK